VYIHVLLKQRALVLSFQRKYKQIVDEFDKKSKVEYITDANLYVLVAKARLKCGDSRGALRDLSKALKYKKDDPNIHLLRGICLENLEEWRMAAREFTEAINLDSKFSKAFFHRGVCLIRMDKKGIDDLNIAIKFDKQNFEAFVTRALYHYNHGNYEKGIDDINAALHLEPMSIRAYLLRGSCRCKLNDYESAINDFTRAIQVDKVIYLKHLAKPIWS
jgi:tetratricopeptide (TPR) repeat protein